MLNEELKVFKVAVMAEFDVHDVALSLRSRTLLPQIIPNPSHLLQSCFSVTKVEVLHELVAAKQVPVRFVFLINFSKDSVIFLELCN